MTQFPRASLAGLPDFCRFGNFHQSTRRDVIYISVDGDIGGNERVRSDSSDIRANALRLIAYGQPVYVSSLVRARALADVAPSAGVLRRRLEARGLKRADYVVGKGLHATIGVMHDEPFSRSQHLIRDDQ